jgi:hypothetical protein
VSPNLKPARKTQSGEARRHPRDEGSVDLPTSREGIIWSMPHPHGTIDRYNNQRCRCDACRAAIRDYRRAQRAQAASIEQARPLNRSSGPAYSVLACYFPAGSVDQMKDPGRLHAH